MEREGVVTVYAARWEADGRTTEAEVTAEGDLLEIEEIVPADSVPEAVRRTAEERLAGAPTVTYVWKMVFVYEAEGVVDGRHREVLVFPTGSIAGSD
jgi:hypothetical protein